MRHEDDFNGPLSEQTAAPPPPSPELVRLRTKVEHLTALVAKYEARLQIDHCYEIKRDGDDIKTTRVEIPSEKRGSFPDAIECRDAEIVVLKEREKNLCAALTAARQRITGLEAEVTKVFNKKNHDIDLAMKNGDHKRYPMAFDEVVTERNRLAALLSPPLPPSEG